MKKVNVLITIIIILNLVVAIGIVSTLMNMRTETIINGSYFIEPKLYMWPEGILSGIALIALIISFIFAVKEDDLILCVVANGISFACIFATFLNDITDKAIYTGMVYAKMEFCPVFLAISMFAAIFSVICSVKAISLRKDK